MVSEPPWLLSLRLDALLLHVSSLDAALPLLILQHARKTIFVFNNTDKKNIVSDNCHKLGFYFLHVRHTFDLGFAGLRTWCSGGTATRCRCSPRKYDSGRTSALLTHAQWCTSRSSARTSLST